MNIEQSIDAINSLVEINNDRIEGYETASNQTEESDLKAFFAHCIQTSRKCRAELVSEVHSLGGTPAEGTKTTGKLYRVWMDFKAMMTGNDRKAILNSCEYGEDVAIEAYEDVLKNKSEHISNAHHALLSEQLTAIRADHDKVKALRDMLVEH